MCFFGEAPGQIKVPPEPAPPPPIPVAAATPTEVDPAVKQARDDAKRRAAALQGYGSTIATSGLGVTTPAPLTTSGGKALLGQ